MNHYVYIDNSLKPAQIIFEADAKDILEADSLYEAATGKNPIKQPHIGCDFWVVGHPRPRIYPEGDPAVNRKVNRY